MRRYENFSFDPSLREVLDRSNAEDLKRLVALLPEHNLKAPRKADLIGALERSLLSSTVMEIWKQLGALEQSAVAEAAHSMDGTFDQLAFQSKYGALPVFETEGKQHWYKSPTLLRLFIHPAVSGQKHRMIPKDLRKKVLEFIPEPPAAQLTTLEQIPVRPPREWTSSHFNSEKREREYVRHEMPLMQRSTEQAATQDLRTILRLIDQEKLAVSSTTLLPSKAAMTLLYDLLREHDYFELTPKLNKWDSEIGPVKGFSWPLLVQAARLAGVRNGKLSLTKRGRTALEEPPAQVLREIWNAWLSNKMFDEFSRIDTIKGQKGKGGRSFTQPADRRCTINQALADCPVGRWVELSEFSRYMQAAGFQFEISNNAWGLYISDPQYGSLGYNGYGGWNILQERYLLCLLFEYAAPLGMIDIAYEHPAGARKDFREQWGADDLIFLSRYDGLRYFRLTPLGAFILGLSEQYEARAEKPGVSLTVLPNRHIRVDQGELSPDQTLLIENFADREGEALWSLNEVKTLKSVEKGASIPAFRAFLESCDSQSLPETVEGFLAALEKRGAACLCKGTGLIIECLSPEIAETIVRDPRAGKVCQRTGDQGLVVPLDKEKSFREALNALGYGMPRV